MNKSIFRAVKITVIGGCMMLMVASCKPTDSQIAKATTTAVATLAPQITVNVHNGIVAISGSVPDSATRFALDSTVKKVNGVVSIVDSISVLPPRPRPPHRIR